METIKTKNKLEQHVYDWLKETAEDGRYENEIKGVLLDLVQGGCASGMVSHLIYYVDTIVFYNTHQSEINELLAETATNSGIQPAELFGDKWDKNDPLALGEHNQNLLAWFGFEETAQQIAQKLNIEI